MILVIDTQFQENYGAHDWDGEGACPQRWKFKGGSSYKVTNVPNNLSMEQVVNMVSGDIVQDSDYAREYILGYRMEADDYLSEFEQSQLEYEGSITYKEPVIDYLEVAAVYHHEYAEWAADLDAQYYGA
jgi:hypothetical protein